MNPTRTAGTIEAGLVRRAVAVGLLATLALLAAACGTGDAGGGPTVDPTEPEVTGDGDGPPDGGGETNGDGEILWFLPPSGPRVPEDDERDVYVVLEAADPAGCADELSAGALSEPPPAGFSTGARSYHLYRAGAHLCLGDLAGAQAAFGDALAEAWQVPAHPDTRGRVCRVWDAVTGRVDPGAGPCTLEAEPDATETDGTETDATETDATETDSSS